MVIQHAPDEALYRCLLCDTCLIHSPFAPEAWTIAPELNAGRQPGGATASRPRLSR
jgi:hypothetical protein